MPSFNPHTLMFQRLPDSRSVYRGHVLEAGTASELRRRLDRHTSVYMLLMLTYGTVVNPLLRTIASTLPYWWPAPTLTLPLLIGTAIISSMEMWRRRWIMPLYAGAEREDTHRSIR